MSTFKRVSNTLSNSHWFVGIYLLFIAGLYLGIRFFIEDFSVNLALYKIIPTRKLTENLIYDMAFFIQIAPILFGYMFIDTLDRRNRSRLFYGSISLLFLVTDVFIGVYVRSDGFDLPLIWNVYSVVEDIVFFSIGSEVLLIMSFGILLAGFPNVLRLIRSRGKSHYVPPSNNPFTNINDGNYDWRRLSRGVKLSIYKDLGSIKAIKKAYPGISSVTAKNWLNNSRSMNESIKKSRSAMA